MPAQLAVEVPTDFQPPVPETAVIQQTPKERDLPDFSFFRRRMRNAILIWLSDLVALNIGIFAAGLFRLWWKGESMIPEWYWAVLAAWSVGAIILDLLPGWGLGAVEELRRTVGLAIGVFAIVALGLFLVQTAGEISRLTLTASFVVGLPLLIFLRRLMKRGLIAQNAWGLPAVLYGGGQGVAVAINALREESGLGYIPAGVFSDEEPPASGEIAGLPWLGSTACITQNAPVAILAAPEMSRHQVVEMLEGPLSTYRHVVIIPDLLEAPSLWVTTRDLGGILGLEVSHNLLDPMAQVIKRTTDLLVTVATAPLWMPLCLLISLLIRLEDRKPALFLQDRVGVDGKPFKTWKFRTMVPNAEEVLRKKLEEDEDLRDQWNGNFKLKKDPRITRVGRLLRITSLDEIPQLFNVLFGQMAIVGPRPLPDYHYQELPARVRRMRDRVRPGITGLWQVSGRSDAGTEGMRRWDVYYVRNWSIWLDLVIIVRTFRAVLDKRGAY